MLAKYEAVLPTAVSKRVFLIKYAINFDKSPNVFSFQNLYDRSVSIETKFWEVI